jgi:hypothetical protein
MMARDIEVLRANIPLELQKRAQWVVWKYIIRRAGEKPTKVPFSPHTGKAASTTNSATWGTFDEALACMQHDHEWSIGFVVTGDDPYIGVDLDHCYDPATGSITDPIAQEIVERLASYTEITPSGTGVRVWVKGTLPSSRCRTGNVEMYQDKRYFALTGNVLPADPPFPTQIRACQAEINDCYAMVFGSRPQATLLDESGAEDASLISSAIPSSSSTKHNSTSLNALSAEELEEFLSSDAKIKRLWNSSGKQQGDTSLSAVQLALANYAARYGFSSAQLYELLDLHRRKHGGKRKGAHYYRPTIEKALQAAKEYAQEQQRIAKLAEAAQAVGNQPCRGRLCVTPEQRTNALMDLTQFLGVEICGVLKDKTDENPEYQLVLPHGTFVLGTIDALINPHKFRLAIANYTGKLLPPFGKTKWPPIAQLLLVACEEVDHGPSATRAGQTEEWLRQYLQTYSICEEDQKDTVLSSQMPCRIGGAIHISLAHFNRWIFIEHAIRLSEKALGKHLRAFGAEPHPIRFLSANQSPTTRHLWVLPALMEAIL